MPDYAEINPVVLKWARERSGYAVDDVARRANVKPSRVEAWESGAAPLTLKRLDLLANLYKRPTIVFYLDEAPTEADIPVNDFRDQVRPNKPPELRWELRRAFARRQVAIELFRELDTAPPVFEFACARTEHPAVVGARLREILGVSLEDQQSWRTDAQGYKALGAWKDAAENAGALVSQTSKKKLGGCRGLSIYVDTLPAIVLASESPRGRIFTLMHELVHLGLRQGGLCDLHDAGVEAFCNKVAAATLMPRDAILAEPAVRARNWNEAALKALARLYSVSEHALVLRLLTLQMVDQAFYASKREIYDLQAARAEAELESAAIPQHTLAIAANGRGFTQLVLDAYSRGTLTAHRAATHLNTSFRWFADIERDMVRARLGKG